MREGSVRRWEESTQEAAAREAVQGVLAAKFEAWDRRRRCSGEEEGVSRVCGRRVFGHRWGFPRGVSLL